MWELIRLLRMKRWAQNPPSRKRVILVLSVIGACLTLVIFEAVFGWPEFLTVEGVPRRGGIPR